MTVPEKRQTTTMEITVREDESRLPQAFRRFFVFDLLLVQHLGRLWHSRWLLWSLVVRGLRSRYKQSMLGIGWALLTPAAITIVVSYVFTRSGLTGKVNYPCPFPIYALCMLTFWNFFQRGILNGSTALVSNMDLVTKVYFPREVLPISSVLMNLVDWFVAFLMFMVVAFVGTHYLGALDESFPELAKHFAGTYRFVPHVRWLWIPVFMFFLTSFILGLAFFAATMQVYFRDVSHLINLALLLWLFLTPIFYPLRALAGGRATTLIIVNPMTGLLDGIRLVLISRQDPWENHVMYAAAFSVTLLLAGYSFFKHEERYFADVV
ncbi:MAG: ABC transporter permease [Candidatus Sumerlaeia bacterium]